MLQHRCACVCVCVMWTHVSSIHLRCIDKHSVRLFRFWPVKFLKISAKRRILAFVLGPLSDRGGQPVSQPHARARYVYLVRSIFLDSCGQLVPVWRVETSVDNTAINHSSGTLLEIHIRQQKRTSLHVRLLIFFSSPLCFYFTYF